MELVIVSPYTHLNGHYWPYTVDLLNAVSAKTPKVSVFASRKPRFDLSDCSAAPEWHACCPWTRFMLPDARRAKHWGSRSDNLVRNLEFHLCLKRAMRSAERGNSTPTHIHCIESRHRILIHALLNSGLSFSSLCVGEPNLTMNAGLEQKYRRAFATGRLTFFVETEAVAQAWRELAGEHVIHIPAALPWVEHRPMDQADARQQLNLPESAFICLFFGTHREGKDYRLAIEAAKACKSNPFLLFVGPLISGNDPQTLLSDIGYNHALSWNGYLPDEDVPAVFDACDVVMLPYADNYVKGSAVLLQACHYHKPVIATNTGHLREFVTANQNGLLFDAGSVESLAACYDELGALKLSNRLADRFGFEASVAKYSWSCLIERYCKVFSRHAA
jgi:glycosyltransferase involved in cell wall biosynthesis